MQNAKISKKREKCGGNQTKFLRTLKKIKFSHEKKNENQIEKVTKPLLDTVAILEQFKIMEELKKTIITPMERIYKDLAETKELNYTQYKFKILIFTLLYQNGSYIDMSVFSDYMYFRRISFTPERLSTISDEELDRLSVKKILYKLKPNTKIKRNSRKNSI